MRIPSAIYGAVIVLCVVFWGLAFQMEEWKARLLPLLISSCVLALALMALIQENFGAQRGDRPSPGGPAPVDDADSDLGRYLVSGAWVIGLFIASYVLGFFAGISLYCLFYAKTYGATWAASLTLAVVTPLAVYLIFDVALSVELYRGLVFSMMAD